MIPPFNDLGYLPAGVHLASLDEIEARFARSSEIRQVQMDSIRWLVDLATRAGVQRIVLNGSFATDIMEPNDVDCVLLFERKGRKDAAAFRSLRDGLPFLGITIVSQKEFETMINDVFGTDRHGNAKGMLEVAP